MSVTVLISVIVCLHRISLAMFGFPSICSVCFISIDAHIVSYIFITFIILDSVSFGYAENMRPAMIKRE
jgi:hypothetical protein